MQGVVDVARRWRSKRAIIVGDTNSGRPHLDEESRVFGDRYDRWFDDLESLKWHDGFRALHGDKREFTWYSPQKDNGFRLDQAFVSRSLKEQLVSVRHLWITKTGSRRRDVVSDHAALVVDLAQ